MNKISVTFGDIMAQISLVLTGLNVDLIGCILFISKHTDNDCVVTVLDELLHLFYSLDLFRWRTCLLTHVLDNAWWKKEG